MTIPASAAEDASPPAPTKLDDVMLAMDVVDVLRHRERLVERELGRELREGELVERLRALYKSQGIEVPDQILWQGVRALEESRFVYTPPPPGLARTLANAWVTRARWGRALLAGLAALAIAWGGYQVLIAWPAERAAEQARIELVETLPRQLAAAHQAVLAEARVDAARERAGALLGSGQAAIQRGDAARARATIADLDALATELRQEYTLRIAGRPEEQTGFWRELGFGRGRTYYLVVGAVDARGTPVRIPVRNAETNATETVSRFAVAVPPETFESVRADKARNGMVQNARLAEKRRGFLEPEFRMPALEGRITRW